MKAWSPAMRVLTILITIQSYMASIKPVKEPVSEERIQEPRNSVNEKKSKAKKARKAGPKSARKRESTSTASLEPAHKKISKNIQQALPESSQLGESQAVDEKIKAARIKEMVQFPHIFIKTLNLHLSKGAKSKRRIRRVSKRA